MAISEGITPALFSVLPTASMAGTLSQVLEDVPVGHVSWRRREYLEQHAARHAAKGGHFKRNLVDGDATAVTCIGTRYWKGRTTEPQLVAPHDPALSRLLTPREHALVKSLPPALAEAIVTGRSPTRAHELLGQSVVWNCFRDVGRAIGRAVLTGRQGASGDTPVASPGIQLALAV